MYWLQRHLVALAEEACDEATLLDFRCEDYARILVEFATEVGPKGSRLPGAFTVATHRSLINRRLEHIFSVGRHAQESKPPLRLLLVAIFVPAVYLAASVHFLQRQNSVSREQTATISIASNQQADQLESQLQQDPENLAIRGALMAFYANEGIEPPFTLHLLWVINHHPEDPIATMRIYGRSDSSTRSLKDPIALHMGAVTTYEGTKAAWDDAVNKHPSSPNVLFHAALFLESNDPKRALELGRTASRLATADSPAQAGYLRMIADIYATAIMTDRKAAGPSARTGNTAMDETLASALRTEIESTSDPALLCEVGTNLVKSGQDEEGLSLIQGAIDQDPMNPRWREALDSATAEPVRRQNLQNLKNTFNH